MEEDAFAWQVASSRRIQVRTMMVVVVMVVVVVVRGAFFALQRWHREDRVRRQDSQSKTHDEDDCLPPPPGRPISGGVDKDGGFVCGDIIVIIIVKNGIIEQVWLQIYVKRELFYDNQQQC